MTTKTKKTTKTASLSAREISAQPSKERWLRQWAAKIVSELPTDHEDAVRVIALAGQLHSIWIAPRSARPQRGRAGR